MGMTEDLGRLGKEIETAKKSVATLEGRKQEILSRLKEEFQISSIEEAEDLLSTMNEEIAVLETKIEKDFKDLQSKFQW